jgi:hypothetical protein
MLAVRTGTGERMGGTIAMDYAVRGGTATADLLQKSYGRHQGAPGVYGLSVQYAPGQSKTLKELALAGQLRNGRISYAAPDELAQALLSLGYAMQLLRTPGIGFHHTLCVVYDASGRMLRKLPRDAAEALDRALHRIPNPALQP